MNYTQYLELRKPQLGESALVEDINYNAEDLDDAIKDSDQMLAPIVTGDVAPVGGLSAGQFIIKDRVLYTVNENLLEGASLVGKLTPETNGGLNALKDSLGSSTLLLNQTSGLVEQASFDLSQSYTNFKTIQVTIANTESPNRIGIMNINVSTINSDRYVCSLMWTLSIWLNVMLEFTSPTKITIKGLQSQTWELGRITIHGIK